MKLSTKLKMNILKATLLSLIITFFLIINFANALDYNIPKTDQEWNAKVSKLKWKTGPGYISHKKAKASIYFNKEYWVLEGEDARQILYWNNGLEIPTDIYAENVEKGYYYDFEFSDSGLIKIDDWEKINANDFIKEKRETAKQNNPSRQAKGLSTITNIKWNEKPTLDRQNNQVYYSLLVTWSDGQQSIDSKILTLGRRGYTTITLVSSPESYSPALLKSMSKNYQYGKNEKYTDWKSGDKVAALGIGALLASSLGLKAVKPGLLAVILGFLKKFWFIIFLPFIALGNVFKKMFSKGKK